ncbi:hypothetical protein SAMN06297468_3015 [Altererythrobacter xiamenensis]|uniref:Protease inhibitor Inh n=1 Tax=Altererythrobacter xiamenensis TaxID=1316679 RepID=A0A1Y6FMC8_9SPHN|nr:hypothetical protein [Altererythrobacter xiamenensis]SMQ75867.1 hypothetical protein SAMN06297468_3015 [Altererythrobacter xiamenensis]
MRLSPALLALATPAAFAVSACTPESETGSEAATTSEPSEEAQPEAPQSDLTLAESGWLVVGEDGAVYTTMLDPDGTYRDFRNGEALQSGEWEKRQADEVCFVPSDNGKAGDCWTLGTLERDNTLRATDSEDRAVELRKISYVGPGEGDDEGDGEDDQGSGE